MAEPEIMRVHEDLMSEGVIAPVATGGEEERLWLDCDLASLAENRLGDTTSPHDLDAARRADWQARATEERPCSLEERSRFERCYWLVEGGSRVGTIALGTYRISGSCVPLSSFYVFPSLRGQGVGTRVLDRAREAAARHKRGLRLDTSWCWQRAVRFYLAAGMWIYMWKRELTFCWFPGLPRPDIEVSDSAASLSVRVDGETFVLAGARRQGGALELIDAPRELEKNARIGEAYYIAPSTLALAMALKGWPLVRSRKDWDELHYADGGPPESLAYKITIWEAYAKSRGFRVEAPRIPDLEYPTWDEFQARWAKEDEEIEARMQQQGDA